ncbi:MAG: hypothetical protein V3S38_02850 [Acidimicrobiia bacterium]
MSWSRAAASAISPAWVRTVGSANVAAAAMMAAWAACSVNTVIWVLR